MEQTEQHEKAKEIVAASERQYNKQCEDGRYLCDRPISYLDAICMIRKGDA